MERGRAGELKIELIVSDTKLIHLKVLRQRSTLSDTSSLSEYRCPLSIEDSEERWLVEGQWE
jgi:hypothetical protein